MESKQEFNRRKEPDHINVALHVNIQSNIREDFLCPLQCRI